MEEAAQKKGNETTTTLARRNQTPCLHLNGATSYGHHHHQFFIQESFMFVVWFNVLSSNCHFVDYHFINWPFFQAPRMVQSNLLACIFIN
jgi:hypothetical protein